MAITSLLNVFLLAMTPFGELRAALPLALLAYKMPLGQAYFVSLAGNLIPPLLLLLFLKPVANFFSQKSVFCQKFFIRLFQRTNNKITSRTRRYHFLGLMLFVAIPLPLTGAWTGAIIAYLLKMPFKKAFLAIALGVAIAGVIVSALTIGGIAVNNYFGFSSFLLAIVIVIILSFSLKIK